MRSRVSLLLAFPVTCVCCADIWGFHDLIVYEAADATADQTGDDGSSGGGSSSSGADGSSGSSGGSSSSSGSSSSGSGSGSGSSSGHDGSSGSGSSSGGTLTCDAGQQVCVASGTCIPAGTCCTSADCTGMGEICPMPGGACESPDAAGDSGCGPLDTTTNCGACGSACSLANETTVTCTSGTCTYVCSAGYASCDTSNHAVAGCACPAASLSTQGTVGGCCGTSCQTQHNNGVGGYYFDCVALSTYNSTQAQEAATSDTSQTGTVWLGQCGSAPNVQSAVFRSVDTTGTTGTCAAWVYSGSGTYNGVNLAQTVGTTYVSSGTGSDVGCFCGLLTSPNWN